MYDYCETPAGRIDKNNREHEIPREQYAMGVGGLRS